MNQELVGRGRYLANTFADTILKHFPHHQGVADYLKSIQVTPEDYSEALLSGVGMSPSWRRRGKMAVFFFVVDGECCTLFFLSFPLLLLLSTFLVMISLGVESSMSMDEVLRKRYRGKLEYREVDLVDRLPPPRRLDQLALTAAPSAPPAGSSASEGDPLNASPISAVMPLGGTRSSSVEGNEDSKEGIIVDAR